MPVKRIPAFGWDNCIQLSNPHAEVLITVDVGPRILRYQLTAGENVLRAFPDQLGTRGEPKFVARGGHRLWVAPENDHTYAPDNDPVEHKLKDPNAVHLVNPARGPWHVRKEMTISLAPESSATVIRHRVTNEGDKPIAVASWGLTVMTTGGIEVIPQPPLGTHEKEFLPNRVIVPWTYTDFSDDRWRLGRRFIFLQPKEGRPPTKIGLSHRERWAAYLLPKVLFLKVFDYQEGALYPDLGCNFETFSKDDLIELETLSPIKELRPDEAVDHIETWHLFAIDALPEMRDEETLYRWFQPFLGKIGIS